MNRSRFAFVRLIAEHNPFYLLSAACMLGSILALTNSLSWSPIPIARLLILIVTLNVYEAVLIALGLYLIVRRGNVRDGRILLILEAIFLVDTTFLNAEIVTAHYRLGVAINVVLFALAAVKIGIVLHILRPDFSRPQFAFVLIQIAALFTIPCVYRGIDHGTIAPTWFYGGWWLLGLMPAAYELLVHTPFHRHRTLHFMTRSSLAAPIRLYLALPWISIMLHVSILHYVYDVTFYGADAAPVLLGLTLVMNRAQPSKLIPRRDLAFLQFLLPIAAMLVSLNNPHVLNLQLFHWRFLSVSPLGLSIAGAYLTYVYCFFAAHTLLLLGTATLAVLMGKLGPSTGTIYKGVNMTWRHIANMFDLLVPKSLTEWGIIGLFASFVFLVLGAMVSLHRPRVITVDADAPDHPL